MTRDWRNDPWLYVVVSVTCAALGFGAYSALAAQADHPGPIRCRYEAIAEVRCGALPAGLAEEVGR